MNAEKNSGNQLYFNIYLGVVTAMGLLAVIFILTRPLPPITIWEIIFLTLLNLCFSFFQVILPSGMSLSLSFPITMGTFLLFGPIPAIIAITPGLTFHSIRRRRYSRIPFNIGQVALSLILAGYAFEVFGAFPNNYSLGEHFLLMVGILFLFDVFSNALVCGALFFQGQGPFFSLFYSSLITDVIKIIPVYYTIGIIFALVYQQEGMLGGILVSLPLLSVYFILRDQELIKESKEKAMIDPLTNLYNRRYLENWFEENLAEITRDERNLSVLMIDIDDFKQVNDSYGHQVGDQVLQGVARLLEQSVREDDLIIRYGGEEFTVILPDTSTATAGQVGERIRKNIAGATLEEAGPKIQLTVSIGMSSLQSQDMEKRSAEELIRQADKATYRAKFQGKNQVCSY